MRLPRRQLYGQRYRPRGVGAGNSLRTEGAVDGYKICEGLFYAAGVKANVLFFDNKPPCETSKQPLWVYDLRSDNRFSLKAKPLRSEDLAEFVELYRPEDRTARSDAGGHPRWRAFERAAILDAEDARLDLSWSETVIENPPNGLSRLDELSDLIAEDLETALAHIRRVTPRRT